MMTFKSLYLNVSLGEALKKAIFPDDVDFFGISVNPTLIAAFIVSAFLIAAALIIRYFYIPKFTVIPKKFQIFLESAVKFFDNIARENAESKSDIIGCYIYTAALYICFGTLIELIGLRPVMSSINACLATALVTYFLLVYYAFRNKGVKSGLLSSIKEITVPVSMTFRLFGSILSGFIVMALIYHYIWLSFVVPVLLSVIFTLFHAIIQSYIFSMLSSVFIGEALERKINTELSKE
jgi:F-type H+-transporting ATPase subunit a